MPISAELAAYRNQFCYNPRTFAVHESVGLALHNFHLSDGLVVLVFPFLSLPLVFHQFQDENCDKGESL